MPSYTHLPPPPVPFTQVSVRPRMRLPGECPPATLDTTTATVEPHALYAWITRDLGGEEHIELVSLTDYLWRAIQEHCQYACHTLHLSLRGAWRADSGRSMHQADVELGDHSGRRIVVQEHEWPEFVSALCLQLMPGWWTPPPVRYLTGLGGGLPPEWLAVEKQITALKPGQCLRVLDSQLALPKGGHLYEALMQRTPMDAILEQITGSAYELTLLRRERGFLNEPDWLVRRLQQPLSAEKSPNTRAYISPDRRAGWTQDPRTGLWHRQ